jgi:uncharacterized protein YdhG (YjbR/CyaY superfamily)
MTTTSKRSSAAPSTTTAASGFSEGELAAMRERAAELRASGRGGDKKAAEAELCLAKIAEMPEADRGLAERIHAIVVQEAPELDAKTWYGMPAYARDGKVVMFFKPAEKFGSRYATLGFEDAAALDDGSMWPTSYAVTSLSGKDEKAIAELVRRAARG